MKKILLLGGSAQQVIAIQTAKRLGYYTVLCDFLTDNPGQYEADKFYLISTTDKEAILDIAIKEGIDGILAYASDPAAPTAAYVAEKLGLPGNPYQSVEILCNKDKFRQFLKENAFNTPIAKGYQTVENAILDAREGKFTFPVIIKPVDSSGSKGVTVLHTLDNFEDAVDFAFSFSRSKRIIVEEFIEKKHKYLIGGDIFIYRGQVIQWGLMNCHRDSTVNPLVPTGKSYPPQIENADLRNVQKTLQDIINKLNIKNGAMNVELVIDKQNRVFPIDIGPRSGGNMIPDLLGMIFDTDVVEMSVKVAMGEDLELRQRQSEQFFATHNLHANTDGIFQGISYSEKIQNYIVKKYIYKNMGDKVEYFDNASKALGILFFKFSNAEKMENILNNINKYIKIKTTKNYLL